MESKESVLLDFKHFRIGFILFALILSQTPFHFVARADETKNLKLTEEEQKSLERELEIENLDDPFNAPTTLMDQNNNFDPGHCITCHSRRRLYEVDKVNGNISYKPVPKVLFRALIGFRDEVPRHPLLNVRKTTYKERREGFVNLSKRFLPVEAQMSEENVSFIIELLQLNTLQKVNAFQRWVNNSLKQDVPEEELEFVRSIRDSMDWEQIKQQLTLPQEE